MGGSPEKGSENERKRKISIYSDTHLFVKEAMRGEFNRMNENIKNETVVHKGLKKNLTGMLIVTIIFNIVLISGIIFFIIIDSLFNIIMFIIMIFFLNGLMLYVSHKYKRRSPFKIEFFDDKIQFYFKIKKKNRKLSANNIEFLYIDHQPYWFGEHNNMKFFLKNGEVFDIEAINGELHRKISEWIVSHQINHNRDYNIPVMFGKKKEGFDQYTWMELEKKKK